MSSEGNGEPAPERVAVATLVEIVRKQVTLDPFVRTAVEDFRAVLRSANPDIDELARLDAFRWPLDPEASHVERAIGEAQIATAVDLTRWLVLSERLGPTADDIPV